MIITVSADELIGMKASIPLIDVRSPLEFEQGHIPGAVNVPLFSDQERAAVGTRYQQAGREAAFLLGLDFVGVKMSGFVKKIDVLCRGKEKVLAIYCWRGGMRSASMAWLFSSAGYKVNLLNGGYKVYRAWIRAEAGKGVPMIVLGGMTGAGKTQILLSLKSMGEQVIDLENLACNKGSVFGYLGQAPQPTNEQFENNLFDQWMELDSTKPVWLEDESRSIGAVGLPGPFFDQMKISPMLLLNVPAEWRVKRLMKEYAGFDKALLGDALIKIAQPLGGLAYLKAAAAIEEARFEEAIALVLEYYDKTYRKALDKFKDRTIIEVETVTSDAVLNARLVLNEKLKLLTQPMNR